MKRLFLTILFIILSTHSFAEITFGINSNINFLNETYRDVNYKRFLAGFGEQIRLEVYRRSSFIGFFAYPEFGFYFNDDQNDFNGYYFLLSAGPSFILRTGSKHIYAIASIGPMLQWYREIYTVEETLPYIGKLDMPRAYGATDIGGLMDLAVILKTRGKFFGRLGVTGELVFYRSESGQSIRNVDNSQLFEDARYIGFAIKPHIGIGWGYLFD